tara:strand:- start:130606 stop:130917 length:312 start_codon:yes stop_codon:yes gene_type:complete
MDKKALELIYLIEETLTGKMRPNDLHDKFWSDFWPNTKNDWPNKSSEEIQQLIALDIFDAFECFDGEHAITEANDVPYELTEDEFLKKCKEFLPKLKKAVKKI